MAYFVIVKRDEESLFEYLRQHFQEPDITVILDRRERERRRAGAATPADRRRDERRAYPADADPLWRFGFRVATERA